MIVISGLEQLTERFERVILTIGNFDGLHIGHQKILRAVAERSKAVKGTAMAMTFDPHPVRVLEPERRLSMLIPFDEKVRLMGLLGIDVVLSMPFTRAFAGMKPDDFVRDVIVGRIGANEVIVGHGYAFGKGKKGTTELLRRRGRKHGFLVRVVRNARFLGDVVSSSRVRDLLIKGRVKEASLLLGRPYMIEGRVVTGAGRGEKVLQVPTANMETPYELAPKEGVYAVKVGIRGRLLEGVANIGRNPTFDSPHLNYEVHLLDFSGSILGEEIRVFFVDRLRDEKRFPDAATLKEHIIRDIARAREIFAQGRYPDPVFS
jgi:riboflavin kinase / FMN adenylyltransferase